MTCRASCWPPRCAPSPTAMRRRRAKRSSSSPTMIRLSHGARFQGARRPCRGDHRFAQRCARRDAAGIPVITRRAVDRCHGRQGRERRRARGPHAHRLRCASRCRAAGARSSISPATRARSRCGTTSCRPSCRPTTDAGLHRRRLGQRHDAALATALPMARERRRALSDLGFEAKAPARPAGAATRPSAPRRCGG